jgi:hypothetical protein
MIIDNSALGDLASCEAKYFFRHKLHMDLAEKPEYLTYGTIMHKVITTYHINGRDDAENVLTDAYKEFHPEDKKHSLETAAIVLDAYAEKFPREREAFSIVHGPTGFLVQLNARHWLSGEFDMLVRHKQLGSLLVFELKTATFVTETSLTFFSLSSQITGYIYGVSQHFNLPVSGAYITVIKKSVPPQKISEEWKSSLFRRILVNRTPEEIEAWRRAAIRLCNKAANLTAKNYTRSGMFNHACENFGGCQYLRCCVFNTTPDEHPEFVKHTWRPF